MKKLGWSFLNQKSDKSVLRPQSSSISLCLKVLFYGLGLLYSFSAYTQTDSSSQNSLLDLSIEELMKMKVVTASGKAESHLDAAATMVVIRAIDIKKRGYTDLTEVMFDLPGFDVIDPNGRGGVVAYQRGYRTPITQRTLIMINGIVDNDLWSHEALIGKHYPITNIDKIEVLYGPTSALYGANAFLGIINIITKDGSGLESDGQQITTSVQAGSFNTKSVELSTRGKKEEFYYSFSGKYYRSNEADLSGQWGFLSNKLYSDTAIWGPVLQHSHNSKKYGTYYSPSDDYGIIANIGYKDTKLGLISWKNKEGYGSWYAADRAQNNAFWKKTSFQIYLQDKREKDKITLNSLLLFRKNQVTGDWAEAEPDISNIAQNHSYISITNWNAVANSWLFKEDLTYQISRNFSLQSGLKYERKELTKAYDIPGYWHAFSSSVPSTSSGSYGYGAAIGYSTDSVYNLVEGPNPNMPAENLMLTDDIGGYLQFIGNIRSFRFIAGVRHDYNSIYGENTNLRASLIYKFNSKGVIKLVYGEAYQEPPPRQLFGEWNGRKANINLKPEKAKNLELIASYGSGFFRAGTSAYYAFYENVIKEEAENAGSRNILGAEIRSYFSFKNMIPKSANMTAYLYYTFTQSKSSIHYNHVSAMWETGETVLGDIAPHKINMGINVPVSKDFNLNIKGNYVSSRLVYTRNALRVNNYEIPPYFTLDGNLSYRFRMATLSLKVKNITDTKYFQPGLEQADSGNNFNNRSLGYRNSLLPQTGRTYMFSLTVDL